MGAEQDCPNARHPTDWPYFTNEWTARKLLDHLPLTHLHWIDEHHHLHCCRDKEPS